MDFYKRETLEDTWKDPYPEPELLSSEELDSYLYDYNEASDHIDTITEEPQIHENNLEDTIKEVTEIWEELSNMIEKTKAEMERENMSLLTRWKTNVTEYIWLWLPWSP